MIRTFIAIPVEASPALLALTAQLREELAGERIVWADRGNLHSTLRFLGDTPESLVGPLGDGLELLFRNFSPAVATLRGLGCFGSRNRPSVLFAGLENGELPERMAAATEKLATELGFPGAENPFHAHLTLARIKTLLHPRRFRDLVLLYGDTVLQPFLIDRVVLYASRLTPGGALYTPLKTVLFQGPGNP